MNTREQNAAMGYVVLEFNQASGQPSLADDCLHDTVESAERDAQWYRDNLGARGETYEVAEVHRVRA